MFRFDPKSRYELAFSQSTGRVVIYGSPVDANGSRWRIEDDGIVELSIDAVRVDTDDAFHAQVSIRCDATIQLAPAGASLNESTVQERTMGADERRTISDRVRLWAARPDSIVHKIIAIVASTPGGLVRQDLVAKVRQRTRSKNPYGAVASLMTSEGNAYGRALMDDDGIVTIHPDVRDEVARHRWHA